MKEKLTVIIPCKNERENIRACLASVHDIADEILVADSGSDDATPQIAQACCHCRVIKREYRTSGDFKNWAIPQASHEWVLLVDADERVTKKLAAEIKKVLNSPTKKDGYWIYRDNHFMGHKIHYGGYNHDRVLRLFRRDISRYEGPSDHGEVVVRGNQVGVLKSRMLHYSFWSYDQFFSKFHRYTTLQARQWHEEGRKTNLFQLFFRPVSRFLRDYFLLLGILDGRIGLQLSTMAAFYTFTKQARLWANHYGKDRAETEQEYREVIAGSEHLDRFESLNVDEIASPKAA